MTPTAAARSAAPLFLPLLAALCLASCGAGAAPTATSSSAAATVTVHIRNFGFQPGSVTVRRGGQVTWVNEDDVEHTATADSGSWDSGTLDRGQRYSHRFAKDGAFRYHCAFHAFMTGTVRVVGGT